mmetsp:Transcript_8037/g.29221  ORF Transcript_8037/g.29221 Transcript_8037/m.29221 type:complete len:245 (-) Transcript_8037:55-789(-)
MVAEVMPKWFPVDLYTQASAVVHPVTGSASPTVFLAAEGTFSGLHVDFLHTHFWMTLCHGHKRWRVVPRDDLALLYPRYLCDLNPCFPTGLDEAERAAVAAYNEMPALGLAAVHEVILGPGDIVFVPAGAPHKVENLETTVAISANFVDRSNVARSLAEAELLGLVSEDPVHIAACFRGAESGLLSDLEASAPSGVHEPLRAFKARHGEARTPQELQTRLALAAKILVATGASLCLAGWIATRS